MLILYWNDDGGSEHWVRVDGEFYVGRLSEEFIDRVSNPRSLGVYMIWIDRDTSIDMSVDSAWVSRKHLLVKTSNSRAYIIDHGVEGKGSSNGTWLNNRRLIPGKEYLIKPGDNIRLGHDLTLLVGYLVKGEKPLILLNPGRNELPETIVDAGSDKGIERIRRIGEKPLYISSVPVEPVSFETPSGAIVSNDRDLIALLKSQVELYNAILLIEKDQVDEGLRVVKMVLNNRVFRDAIRKKCSSAVKCLEELEKALLVNISKETLARLLRDLVEAIKIDLEL